MPKKNTEEEYYSEETTNKEDNDDQNVKPFPIRKIVVALLILLVLVIGIILFLNLQKQKEDNKLFGPNGEEINSNITISKNGELIDSFKTDGNNLEFKSNPSERITGKIKTNIKNNGKLTTKIVIKRPDGTTISVKTDPNEVYIDEDGELNFSINPLEDLGLEGYFDENTQTYVFDEEENVELELEFVITDEETGETTIIEIPTSFTFVQFIDNGCIALSRTYVRETTHYGMLELNAKLRVLCEVEGDLVSNIEWKEERKGNAEVIIGNYKEALLLAPFDKTAMSVPMQGEYDIKINFVPFEENAGEKATFAVNFGLGTNKAKIDFDLMLDNLEQCVKIIPESLKIGSNEDSTRMTIDVSSCHSSTVEISMCSNDPDCSGGSEGGIGLSQAAFSLSPLGNSSKTIAVSRNEISGAYGIPIHARVSGTEKVFIDEKVVIVEPTPEENITPDKFVISLLGGAKDSVRITNKTLAEDVDIEASICAVYKSSLGIKGDTSLGASVTSYAGLGTTWWRDLATNPDRYSGSGKYQAALINTLAQMDNMRATTQAASKGKNMVIKQAYLAGANAQDSMTDAVEDATSTTEDIQELIDALDQINQLADTDMGSQILAMVTSTASLTANSSVLCGRLSAQETTLSTAAASCYQVAEISSLPQGASTTAAALQCGSLGKQILDATNTINQLYSMYQQIDALSNENESVNAENSKENMETAIEQTKEAQELFGKSLGNLNLALGAASVDSFDSASKDDAKAARYLTLAKQQATQALQKATTAKATFATAADELTTLPADEATKTDLIISCIQLLLSIINAFATLTGASAEVLSSTLEVQTAMPGLIAAANAGVADKNPGCVSAVTSLTSLNSALSSTILQLKVQSSSVLEIVTLSNSVYQAFSAYRQMTADYAAPLTSTLAAQQTAITSINEAVTYLTALDDILPDAIKAAEWLALQEKDSSDAASYLMTNIYATDGNYNRTRMVGVIGSAISGGFVNGAYEGGVYTTADTFGTASSSPVRDSSNVDTSNAGGANTAKVENNNKKIFLADETESDNSTYDVSNLKEDCANKVKLKLPDYIINLLADGKQISVSNPGVTSVWDFSDSQVFDVFEKQEVGMVFVNSGLKKNGYGIVEINVIKHKHDQPTVTNSEFGPFNIPDSGAEPITVKYHFKFNAEPRKGNNYVAFRGNDCTNGLARGKMGNEALPKVIMSWDWNSVKSVGSFSGSSKPYRTMTSATIGSGGSEEPYIDATQLTILLSKKLGALSNFLDSVSASCPPNPAKEILEKVIPKITDPLTGVPTTGEDPNAITGTDCYIPLTTRTYDGKPALYYYVEDKPITEWEEWFSDVERLNNAEELNNLLEFNVNLIRDGYGTDFQYDFYTSFSRTILKAGPSFLDPEMGAKKYLQDSDNAYFSSQANFLKKNQKWAIPDAGMYKVKMVVDFDNGIAKIFNGGAPSAKIIFDLYSLEPVNNNYSPLYYTPVDGFVGLNASSNRRGYGSTANTELVISKLDGAVLDPTQKEALVKITSSKINNFFILNALPSMRGKVLDYTYNYNPITKMDDNSKMILSPTVATPMIFELRGNAGEETLFLYNIKRDNSDITSNIDNAFVLSGSKECSDLAGNPITGFYTRAPDSKSVKTYGVALPMADVTGKTYLKTVAYSPVEYSYSITKPLNGQIFTSNDLVGINNLVSLEGISGMAYNDKKSNQVADSLYNALKGVEQKSLCVSSLGSREVFWWPEDSLFDKESMSEIALSTVEANEKAICDKKIS